MRTKKFLVVEDCPEQSKTYADYARKLGFEVFKAMDEKSAVNILSEQTIDILLCDIHLSRSITIDSFEGLNVIKHAAENSPETIIIAMSNDPKVDTYHKTFAYGAMAYIKKPILRKDEIAIALESAEERVANWNQKLKMAGLQATANLSVKFQDDIILDDKKRLLASKLCKAKDISIIITGETGTGKEEYAKLIHKKRVETDGKLCPFIAVNCANLDGSIAVSTLFGHTKGAFTGAERTTKGCIGDADGGIFFLDEIHHLSIDCQKRLLRVLNDGCYERLGDSKPLRSDFQLIVASTKNLDELVTKGQFLLDLRMRITGIEVYMQPLRDRKDDIPSFIRLFLNKFGGVIEDSEFHKLVNRCKTLYWQGNIRQLSKVIQSMATTSSLYEEPILADNMPITDLMLTPDEIPSTDIKVDNKLISKIIMPFHKDTPYEDAINFYGKHLIQTALNRHKKIKDACAALSMPRSTFDDKRVRWGIMDDKE